MVTSSPHQMREWSWSSTCEAALEAGHGYQYFILLRQTNNPVPCSITTRSRKKLTAYILLFTANKLSLIYCDMWYTKVAVTYPCLCSLWCSEFKCSVLMMLHCNVPIPYQLAVLSWYWYWYYYQDGTITGVEVKNGWLFVLIVYNVIFGDFCSYLTNVTH